MLAGHDEGGGEEIFKYVHNNEYYYMKEDEIYKPVIERKEFRKFYGMSSQTANKKHFGGLKDYRSSEGRTILVPYRGPVANTVQDILDLIQRIGVEEFKNLNMEYMINDKDGQPDILKASEIIHRYQKVEEISFELYEML